MSDYIVRATAANDAIRAFAIDGKELVEKARSSHNTFPVVTAALGRLLCAGAMMGVMQKGENDVLTLQILCDGPLKGLTVTADSKGYVKGFANVTDVDIPFKNGKLDVGGAIDFGFLRVIKDMGLKEPYNSTVQLQTGEIAEDLTYYFARSEQVPSSVGLGVLVDTDNTVKCAGGFIIQLMPFTKDEVIEQLEKNLQELKSVTQMLSEGLTAEEMLGQVLKGFDIEFTAKYDTGFKCDCSRERFADRLATLNEEDKKSIIADGKPIEVTCQFCNSKYEYSLDEFKNM